MYCLIEISRCYSLEYGKKNEADHFGVRQKVCVWMDKRYKFEYLQVESILWMPITLYICAIDFVKIAIK